MLRVLARSSSQPELLLLVLDGRGLDSTDLRARLGHDRRQQILLYSTAAQHRTEHLSKALLARPEQLQIEISCQVSRELESVHGAVT